MKPNKLKVTLWRYHHCFSGSSVSKPQSKQPAQQSRSRVYLQSIRQVRSIAQSDLLKADELITTEKPTKPMHRVAGIQVISV